MTEPIRIVQIGLGPLGQMMTPYLDERNNLKIVGAVDIDPQKAGLDLGALSAMDRNLGVTVSSTLDSALHKGAQVAVVTTVSELQRLYPLLEQLLENGLNIVSTCEELSYPWNTQPELSRKIDALARERNVSVLGTGVNPGFLMDFLPIAITAVCRKIRKLRIERIQDASFRRLPFRQKIGAGLSAEEFRSRVKNKKIRHVGLTESMHMVAARLGWSLNRTEDTVEPVLAPGVISGEGWAVEAGHATGVNQTGRGYIGNEEVLTLIFRAAVGEQAPRDSVHIDGVPEFNLTIPGGVHGDVATCAIITNAVRAVVDAPPGLRTMADMPPISCYR